MYLTLPNLCNYVFSLMGFGDASVNWFFELMQLRLKQAMKTDAEQWFLLI